MHETFRGFCNVTFTYRLVFGGGWRVMKMGWDINIVHSIASVERGGVRRWNIYVTTIVYYVSEVGIARSCWVYHV